MGDSPSGAGSLVLSLQQSVMLQKNCISVQSRFCCRVCCSFLGVERLNAHFLGHAPFIFYAETPKKGWTSKTLNILNFHIKPQAFWPSTLIYCKIVGKSKTRFPPNQWSSWWFAPITLLQFNIAPDKMPETQKESSFQTISFQGRKC